MNLTDQTRICQKDKFEFHLCGDKITIFHPKNGSINLVPGESTNMISLLNSIGSIVSFQVLPAFISNFPFKAHFSTDGTCIISRESDDKTLTISVTGVDAVSKGIQMVVQKVQDINSIRGGPDAGVAQFDLPEPVLEGRE